MTSTEVKAWEFPVMLKHSFTPPGWAGRARPFLAAVPSFRTQEDASAAEPSQFGLTAELGATWRFGPLSFAPTLRYTRWDPEHIVPKYVTKADQIEVLATVAYHTEPESWRVAGHSPQLGALAGLAAPTFVSSEGGVKRIAFIAGLTAEVRLHDRVSVEADGIYKPLRSLRRWRPLFGTHLGLSGVSQIPVDQIYMDAIHRGWPVLSPLRQPERVSPLALRRHSWRGHRETGWKPLD